MTIESVICILCSVTCSLVIIYGYTLDKQNEELRHEIDKLKYMLKNLNRFIEENKDEKI